MRPKRRYREQDKSGQFGEVAEQRTGELRRRGERNINRKSEDDEAAPM